MTEKEILVTMFTYSELYLEQRIKFVTEIGDIDSMNLYKNQLEEFTLFCSNFLNNLK